MQRCLVQSIAESVKRGKNVSRGDTEHYFEYGLFVSRGDTEHYFEYGLFVSRGDAEDYFEYDFVCISW